jgi:hypothetical protein
MVYSVQLQSSTSEVKQGLRCRQNEKPRKIAGPDYISSGVLSIQFTSAKATASITVGLLPLLPGLLVKIRRALHTPTGE